MMTANPIQVLYQAIQMILIRYMDIQIKWIKYLSLTFIRKIATIGFVSIICSVVCSSAALASDDFGGYSLSKDDIPLTTDSRIKTYIYSPNEVYLLVLHHGFQSHIEFAKGETIETMTLGDTYAWKIFPIDNRLFIKPMEKNIRTNMTIITNKRTYQFDLVAKELEDGEEQDLVYLIRFYYPERKRKQK